MRCLLTLAGVLAGGPSLLAALPPPVFAAAYHPAGKTLAAGVGSEVRTFDPETGRPTGKVAVPGRITTLTYDPSGQMLIVAAGEAGRSGTVHLFRCQPDGRPDPAGASEWAAHTDAVYGLAVSPDSRLLATAGYDRLIHLWSLPAATGAKPLRTLKDHSDTVYALAFSPDGTRLASASADRSVKIWDPTTGRRLHTLSDCTDWVYAVAWNPRTGQVVAGGVDKAVRVWDLTPEGGRLARTAFAHEKAVSRLAFGPDGSVLYTLGEDAVLKSWDAARLSETRTWPAQPDVPLCLAVRPDGRQLALGRFDGVVLLIDLTTGKVMAELVPARAEVPAPPPAPPAPPPPPRPAPPEPDGIPSGTTTRVTIAGQGLDRVSGVSFEPAGISVSIVTRQTDRLDLDVTVPAGAPVGIGKLTLTWDGGSTTLPLAVDRFARLAEPASNDAARTAPVVRWPITVVGRIDRPGDTDHIRLAARAGDQIGLQVTTSAAANVFDPVLVVTDAAGTVLAEGGATAGFRAPHDGEYAVALRDREYRGGPNLSYRLHVGPIPVATSVFPLAVTRGQTATVRVRGVNLGDGDEVEAAVTVPAEAMLGSRVPIRVPSVPEEPLGGPAVVAAEFASTAVGPDGAAQVSVPGSADGRLTRKNETHTIRFPARKGERLVVEVLARRAGSPLDPVIEILDAAGRPVPRAVLRATALTYTSFRDHDSRSPGIRLETWNDLAIDDYLYGNGELMRILALPRNPDDDCQFYQVGGQRVGYLGTTPNHHALGSPLYKVELHPPGATFPPNGLPTFALSYRNDDGGPGYGQDSYLLFEPPADGTYQVRVSDARGSFGPAHAYRLTVRRPRPDFSVAFSPTAPAVWQGGGIPLSVTVTRSDGFDGPVRIRLEGLPPGFSAPETTVEAGHTTTAFTLTATADAVVPPNTRLRLVATAEIDGREITREAAGGSPTLRSGGDLVTRTRQSAVVLRPGQQTKFVVDIERRPGFSDRVPLDVRGLPHGVRVLNIGLNGILITERETSREITLYAEPWVRPMTRPVVVLGRSEKSGTEHAAPPVLLHVVPAGP